MDRTGVQPTQNYEYVIYTYSQYDDHKFGVNKWQKRKSTGQFKRALQEAKVLFRSQNFQKIEIQQKYFDTKLGRKVSKTLRIFERKKFGFSSFVSKLASFL